MIDDDVLDRLPTAAGVYLFAAVDGEVVYVGKAKNLRTRVRQYFRPGGDERFFVAAGYLRRAAATVETIVVAGEKEALLLENHLIKRHQPRFNVKLRDDKQYLVLRVLPPPATVTEATPARRRFPRVEVARNIGDDEARYFGPYHSATSARETLRVLNRHFQLRTCTDHVLETRGRVCLQYQIKRCVGPCAVAVDPAAYRDQVDDVLMFLAGKDRELVARLGQRMRARAGGRGLRERGPPARLDRRGRAHAGPPARRAGRLRRPGRVGPAPRGPRRHGDRAVRARRQAGRPARVPPEAAGAPRHRGRRRPRPAVLRQRHGRARRGGGRGSTSTTASWWPTG
jgi:hypothetical protein